MTLLFTIDGTSDLLKFSCLNHGVPDSKWIDLLNGPPLYTLRESLGSKVRWGPLTKILGPPLMNGTLSLGVFSEHQM